MQNVERDMLEDLQAVSLNHFRHGSFAYVTERGLFIPDHIKEQFSKDEIADMVITAVYDVMLMNGINEYHGNTVNFSIGKESQAISATMKYIQFSDEPSNLSDYWIQHRVIKNWDRKEALHRQYQIDYDAYLDEQYKDSSHTHLNHGHNHNHNP